jgi:murein hydrolase activator
MKPLKAASCVALGLILMLSRPALVRTGQESTDYEKRLAKIREEIEGLKGKIAGEEKKEKTMLSALDRIGLTKSLLRNELALLNMQLEKNRVELGAIKKNIPELQTNLEREKDALIKILVTLYKYGRFNVIRFFLQSPDLASLLQESKNLSLLASTQERMIADYAKNLDELGRAAESLKSKERDIQDLIGKESSRTAALEAEEKKNRALIDQIRSNKITYEQTMEELSVQARQLQELLQKLEKQESGLPFPLVPFTEKKGRLPWPAGGKIAQSFGIQRHPKFNTLTMNNGIEIAPGEGDPTVRAVHGGKIVFADYFQGYGNLLIIDHGQTYYSLYGHCAEFKVKTGDFIKAGQPIALAGDTGSMLDVKSLYFEIRYKTKPLDPLQWLSRR